MNKTDNLKNQLILIGINISLLALFIIMLVLNWNHSFWEGVQFKVKDGSVFTDLFDPMKMSLEHSLTGTNNIIFTFVLPIATSLVLTILAFVLCSKKYIKLYVTTITWIMSISTLLGFVTYIILFFACNSVTLILYNVGNGMFISSLIPFIVTMVNTCGKCGYFNTKKLVKESTYKTYTPKYVEGGYRTITTEIKDESGNNLGSLETKVYEQGHTYMSTSTTKTKQYICIKCGDVSETTSKS